MAYTVMVVDDSEIVRSVLERTLTLTKLPIDSFIQAENGKDALEKLSGNWVDIVFSDLHMPEIDGMGLVTAMSQNAELREIPVFIISTEGNKSCIDALLKKGVKGFLRKPFTPEKLRDLMVETLGDWK
jgi:two-component system chemotaxis response regulator CheY